MPVYEFTCPNKHRFEVELGIDEAAEFVYEEGVLGDRESRTAGGLPIPPRYPRQAVRDVFDFDVEWGGIE